MRLRRGEVVASVLVSAAFWAAGCADQTGPGAMTLEVEAPARVRQGDVIQLSAARLLAGGGRDTLREGLTWSLADTTVGELDAEGRFVGYQAGGTARIIVRAPDGMTDTVSFAIDARALAGSFTRVGFAFNAGRYTSDLFLYGDYAYVASWSCLGSACGNRLDVWDVRNPAQPVLTDSVLVDARSMNDVEVSDDGRWAVITHEGSADRKNGLTFLGLADAAHPGVLARVSDTMENGVHTVFVDGRYVYAVVDGSSAAGGLRILDAADPAAPVLVGRFYAGSSFLHDVNVRDGLAFLSHWNAGLIILDVGNGIRGGSPSNPVEVARIVLSGPGSAPATPEHEHGEAGQAGAPVHNAWYWPAAGYVFVGDETGARLEGGTSGSTSVGRLHVLDVSDLTKPVEVADFFLPGDPPHNFWMDETAGILFASWYGHGIRAIDMRGKLLGSLERQGREYAFTSTSGPRGGSEMMGPQLHRGLVYAADLKNGMWVFSFAGR